MEKNVSNNSNNGKSGLATGLGAAIGGAAGVVGGTLAADEIHAAEAQSPELPGNEGTATTTTDDDGITVVDSQPSNPQPVSPEQPENDYLNPSAGGQEPQHTQPSQPVQHDNPAQPAANQTTEVEVLDYQTVQAADGSQMDVAVVSAGGQQIAVIDADRDGVADVMMSDLNGDGQIQDNEIADVSSQNIDMHTLQEAAGGAPDSPVMTASNDAGDFDNDANVDAYA